DVGLRRKIVVRFDAVDQVTDLTVVKIAIFVSVTERVVLVARQVLAANVVRFAESILSQHRIDASDLYVAENHAVSKGGIVAGNGEIAFDDAPRELGVVLGYADVATDPYTTHDGVVLRDLQRSADHRDVGPFTPHRRVVAA